MTQVPVKTEDVDMDAPQEAKSCVAHKFINGDLPVGCEKGNKWRRTFIPTYIAFVASHTDPWSVDDDEAVTAMQLSWNAVYLNTTLMPQVVRVDDAIFFIVSFLSRTEPYF